MIERLKLLLKPCPSSVSRYSRTIMSGIAQAYYVRYFSVGLPGRLAGRGLGVAQTLGGGHGACFACTDPVNRAVLK